MRGNSLVEILVAIVLLGLLGGGISKTMVVQGRRAGVTVEQQTATTLARGQMERIRAAGPGVYDTPYDSAQLTSDGRRDPAGPYTLIVERGVHCVGAEAIGDGEAAEAACEAAGREAVYTYTVTIWPPGVTRLGSAPARLVHTLVADPGVPVGGARCAGGQLWTGSECRCPAGQELTGGVCGCPSGTTWTGSACVTAACSVAGGETVQREVRTDCASNLVGSSEWVRHLDAAGCTWGPWAEESRVCGCPATAPHWSATAGACVSCPSGQIWTGATCSCPAPGPGDELMRTIPCGEGESGAIVEERTHDAETCGYSDWVVTSNSCAPLCPSPRQMFGDTCSCTASNETVQQRVVECSAARGEGWTGQITEERTRATDCDAWGEWVPTSLVDPCTAPPPPPESGSCRADQEWNGSMCICSDPMTYDTGTTCKPFTYDPDDCVLGGTGCTCPPGENYDGFGGCVACGAGTTWDPLSSTCRATSEVGEPPEILLSASPLTVQPGQAVTIDAMIAMGSAMPAGHEIRLSDGRTSGSTPWVVWFETEGTYTVTAEAWDVEGRSGSATATVTVSSAATGPTAALVRFGPGVTPLTNCYTQAGDGLELTVTDGSSVVSPVSFEWWIDGSLQSPTRTTKGPKKNQTTTTVIYSGGTLYFHGWMFRDMYANGATTFAARAMLPDWTWTEPVSTQVFYSACVSDGGGGGGLPIDGGWNFP